MLLKRLKTEVLKSLFGLNPLQAAKSLRSYSLACLSCSSFLFLIPPSTFQSCLPLCFPDSPPQNALFCVPTGLQETIHSSGITIWRPPGNTLSLDKGVDVILHFKIYISPALSPGPNKQPG